jgi:hypothetical protein
MRTNEFEFLTALQRTKNVSVAREQGGIFIMPCLLWHESPVMVTYISKKFFSVT